MPRSRLVLAVMIVFFAALTSPSDEGLGEDRPSWTLPVPGASVLRPFEAPAHDYAAGHRGIDIGPVDGTVLSPADGIVAFAGTVVDRGVVTVDHGDGWVTSVEPIDPSVAAGDVVSAGDPLGTIGLGGHAPPGALHVGVRHDGQYVNPLVLMGRVPRAVLLPCC